MAVKQRSFTYYILFFDIRRAIYTKPDTFLTYSAVTSHLIDKKKAPSHNFWTEDKRISMDGWMDD